MKGELQPFTEIPDSLSRNLSALHQASPLKYSDFIKALQVKEDEKRKYALLEETARGLSLAWYGLSKEKIKILVLKHVVEDQ